MGDDLSNGRTGLPADGGVSAGWVLLASTLLGLLAMSHHPSVHAADIGEAMRRIAALSTMTAIVHGTLMALMLANVYALSEFVLRRGIGRRAMRAGAIAYGAGTVAMLGAALVSGFIIVGVASMGPGDAVADPGLGGRLTGLCRVLNQSCANLGLVAMSAGIVFWSIDLLRDRGPRRWVGLLGCAVGLVPAVALVGGWLRLDVGGMTFAVALQACWNVALATLLLRREI